MQTFDKVRAMPCRQRGSVYSTLIMLALVGLVLTAALKVAPAYLDNNVIDNAMRSMAENSDLASMNIRDIRASLMRTLNTNNIQGFDANNIVVAESGGQEYIDISYESRKPLFYNIDAVIKFDNRYPKN